MREKLEITGVRDRDLRAVLSRHGLAAAIDSGEQLCASCSCVLTWDNISALKVVRGSVCVFCDAASCLGVALEGRDNVD